MFTPFSIILSVLFLVVALVAPLLNPFFRKRAILRSLADRDAASPDSLPPLTVIITAHDDAEALSRNLPAFLEQDYPAPYRVIVVADKADAPTVSVLKRFSDSAQQATVAETAIDADADQGDEEVRLSRVSRRLYSILLPASSRYLSRKKLAVTLGVKAARTEWILLSDPFCRPASRQWLRTMAARAAEDRSLVIGLTLFDDSVPSLLCFDRLFTAFYLMREDLLGVAFRAEGSNLMFRKSVFMGGEGYRGNLDLVRGEYDLLVNKYARPSQTALVLDPAGWTLEDRPSRKAWRDKRLYLLASLPKMERRGRHRLWPVVDALALHGSALLFLAAAVYGICLGSWLIAAAAVVSLLLSVLAFDLTGAKALHHFTDRVPLLAVYPYQWSRLPARLLLRLRFWRADPRDFTTHKQ